MPASARYLLSLFVVLGLTGCDAEQVLDAARQGLSPPPTVRVATSPRSGQDTVAVASFNIQVFGTSKSKKPHVMEILADVVRRFDVVAIQEIRAKDQSLIPRFVQQINATGVAYDSVIGPRLGRTTSKEQYAFIYDTARIEVDRGSVFTSSDPGDLLHREPLVATFHVRGPPDGNAFSFTLVNIHTDPDDTDVELDALADVFRAVERSVRPEDDIIILGDLNVDERHLGRLGTLPNIAYAIAGVKTNTRRTKTYDNIVFDAQATTEYTGQAGVLDLMAEYNLSMAEALAVSDHQPVWCAFGIYEGRDGAVVAGRPAATR